MNNPHYQTDLESLRLGSDGELVSGKFCAYCGSRNATTDHYCQYCDEYIVDQGPDLRARLARISRRGGTARIADASPIDRAIVARLERFDRFLVKLDKVGQLAFAPISRLLVTIADRTRYKMSLPKTALRSHLATKLSKPRFGLMDGDVAISAVEDTFECSIEPRLSISNRLTKVRRHQMHYLNDELFKHGYDELPRQVSGLSIIFYLVIGWAVGLFIGLVMVLILGRVLFF